MPTKAKGHWEFTEKLTPESHTGFVYLIYNKFHHRFYIGRKFYRVRKGKRKGKQHAWESYVSSSTWLKDDIKLLGKEQFRFIILEEYETLGGLGWAETWSLCNVQVPENNDEWYNRRIEKVTWKSPERITDRHKRRLKYYINKLRKENDRNT